MQEQSPIFGFISVLLAVLGFVICMIGQSLTERGAIGENFLAYQSTPLAGVACVIYSIARGEGPEMVPIAGLMLSAVVGSFALLFVH
jgi:hypothetical protein